MSETYSDQLIHFVNESPTPFHVVKNARNILQDAGFQELKQKDTWQLQKAKAYFTIYEDTTIIAFRTPQQTQDTALAIIGAHTDSPNLRVKQGAEKINKGYLQTPIEVYGGVIVNSWVDRDLAIAGRVHVRKNDHITRELFYIKKTLARISQLAIHLNRDINDKGLSLNNEEELIPNFGLANEKSTTSFLKEIIAEEIHCQVNDIISYEVSFTNFQDSCYGGYQNEFIYSARLDNQAMCHAGLKAITKTKPNNYFQILSLFDHEEIGSRSSAGADSNVLKSLITRIYTSLNISAEEQYAINAKSFMISADMAHAIHPNFASKHGAGTPPQMNQGFVIKINNNQRYATNGTSMARIIELAKRKNIPYQIYYHRSDLTCGSTIGPITSSQLAINTIDVGNAMLSMHSSREVCGSGDHQHIIELFTSFYDEFLPQIRE